MAARGVANNVHAVQAELNVRTVWGEKFFAHLDANLDAIFGDENAVANFDR